MMIIKSTKWVNWIPAKMNKSNDSLNGRVENVSVWDIVCKLEMKNVLDNVKKANLGRSKK